MARPALRRASVLAFALTALAAGSPATAGDRALLNLLGFSGDGRYFAFEEYGIQDGSGFAYSSIYVVDLPADKWMYGSPFRAQAGDPNPDRPLADVRAEALGKAQDQLKPLQITIPAEILALLGDGVPAADGKAMTFANPNGGSPGSTEDTSFNLKLTTFPAKSPNDCVAEMSQPARGFALTYAGGGQSAEVHRDGTTLPKSRGCPLDYRLYAVVEPFESAGNRVAIVSSYPFGFEGPDRRFLAVPLGD